MRKSTFTAALVLLAVIAWFGLQGSPPQAADNKPVQKLEYRRVTWGFENDKTMSDMGAQGWEICGVVPNAKVSETVVMFKRAMQ
jgi:hypothetical protein